MTSLQLPFGEPASGRRVGPVRRASSIVSPTRLVAAAALVLVSGAFYGLTAAREFAVDPGAVEITGVHYTDVALVRAALDADIPAGDNVFRVPTARIERAIASLPAVRSVRVVAGLPDHLAVALVERIPIFAWGVAGAGWLVDETGHLFAPATDPPVDASGTPLPAIVDLRAADGPPRAGDLLDTADLEAARVLGALTPSFVGSSAPSLVISVDDVDGWVVGVPGGWRAVFGRFSPVVHPLDDVPRQVQCLRALLVDREQQVDTVRLPLGQDRCGSYTLASPSPAPGRSKGPSRPPSPGRSAAP